MKTDTQKAIEFLNDCQDDYEELQEEGNNKGILEVIKLLEEGENYKGMLEDIKKALIPGGIFEGGYYQSKPFPKLSELEFLREWLSNLEQKYFPKPKSRWHRINNIIYNLNTIGGKVDLKKLTHLLIELRDEEL